MTKEAKSTEELTKEALELVREIQHELNFYVERKRCPTTGSMALVLSKSMKLKRLSEEIAWATAPAFMKAP